MLLGCDLLSVRASAATLLALGVLGLGACGRIGYDRRFPRDADFAMDAESGLLSAPDSGLDAASRLDSTVTRDAPTEGTGEIGVADTEVADVARADDQPSDVGSGGAASDVSDASARADAGCSPAAPGAIRVEAVFATADDDWARVAHGNDGATFFLVSTFSSQIDVLGISEILPPGGGSVLVRRGPRGSRDWALTFPHETLGFSASNGHLVVAVGDSSGVGHVTLQWIDPVTGAPIGTASFPTDSSAIPNWGVHLDVSSEGRAHVAGVFSGSIEMGAGRVLTARSTGFDVFATSIGPGNVFHWAQTYGTPDTGAGDFARAIRSDGTGLVAAIQLLSNSYDFGGGNVGGRASGTSHYVLALDRDGTYVAAVGGTTQDWLAPLSDHGAVGATDLGAGRNELNRIRPNNTIAWRSALPLSFLPLNAVIELTDGWIGSGQTLGGVYGGTVFAPFGQFIYFERIDGSTGVPRWVASVTGFANVVAGDQDACGAGYFVLTANSPVTIAGSTYNPSMGDAYVVSVTP